jgi:phage terminase large subunit-like protein
MSADPQELEQKAAVAQALEIARVYMMEHKREFVQEHNWYPWQHEFFATPKQQTMLLAGNRSGKTMGAGYKWGIHLTGDYPDWWHGFRFEHAPNIMVAGVDNIQLKLVVQKELFGEVTVNSQGKKVFAGGWVHPDEIGRVTWNKVTSDLAQSVEVWGKRGMAMCNLRSYSQSKTGHGTLSFAGTSLDGLWVDECPPDAMIGQLVVRTMTGNMNRGGWIDYTMTPELGKTKLVTKFMEDRGKHQALIGPVSWDECPHLTLDVQEMMLDGIPEHEQDMRKKGVPMCGEGLVFPVSEKAIKVSPILENGSRLTDMAHIRYIRGIDLGINHPTAVAWLAYNPDIDCIYLLKCYAQSGQPAAVHAAAANGFLNFAPCVFPHDIDQTEKGSGKTLRQYYSEAGLTNTIQFQNKDGSRYIEPGIQELYDRMLTDRFKVLDVPENQLFFREMRQYHREDGKIVPVDDDVISAVRYGAIMLPRYGVTRRRQGGARKVRVKKSF